MVAAGAMDACDCELEARLMELICKNGERREVARAEEASSFNSSSAGEESSPESSTSRSDDFSADLVLGEENGFELWLGSMDDALSLHSLKELGFGALLNCALEECERECAAHRGRGRRRRAHARGASAVDDGNRQEGGHALDRDQVRAVALFDGEWYTDMLGRDTSFLGIPADDVEGYDMDRHFEETSEFLQQCRREGRKVLSHCIMGINRSSVAIVAFMCGTLGMSLEEAIDVISKGRGYVLSNRSFLRQLISVYGPDGKRSRQKMTPQEAN